MRLGFAGWPGAGVLAVPRFANWSPFVREVAIQVDRVAVVTVEVGLTVGIHRFDQPEFDSVGHRLGGQVIDNGETVVLVAVDHPDY